MTYDRSTERRNSMLKPGAKLPVAAGGARVSGNANAAVAAADRAEAQKVQTEQHIAQLMEQKQQLDVDRQLRDLDLQREEVALETQYYQLGDSVQSLPPDEYDQHVRGRIGLRPGPRLVRRQRREP